MPTLINRLKQTLNHVRSFFKGFFGPFCRLLATYFSQKIVHPAVEQRLREDYRQHILAAVQRLYCLHKKTDFKSYYSCPCFSCCYAVSTKRRRLLSHFSVINRLPSPLGWPSTRPEPRGARFRYPLAHPLNTRIIEYPVAAGNCRYYFPAIRDRVVYLQAEQLSDGTAPLA